SPAPKAFGAGLLSEDDDANRFVQVKSWTNVPRFWPALSLVAHHQRRLIPRLRLGVPAVLRRFCIVGSLLLDIIQPTQKPNSNTRQFEVEDFAKWVSPKKDRAFLLL